MYYTNWGSVRGGCGHLHQSERTARACLAADRRDCKQAGGYSDRLVFAIERRSDMSRHRSPHGAIVHPDEGASCL